MRIAIMQPYFFPYIGYFQLIKNVDAFVIYDEIKYTKKGWINRNRFLKNGEDSYFTLPLKKDSDFLFVNQRVLSDSWDLDKNKLKNKIKEAYTNAPYFQVIFPIIEETLNFKDKNLFQFIYNSLKVICEFLEINTPIIEYSSLELTEEYKASEKVKQICKFLKSEDYLNPIGGIELYDKEDFLKDDINLKFLKSNNIIYKQHENTFVPYLSIIDVLMFNSKEQIQKMLISDFEII